MFQSSRRLIYSVLISILFFNSCSQSEDAFAVKDESAESGTVFGEGLPEEDLLQQMNINVNDELAAELEAATGEDGYVDLALFPSLRAQGVMKMRRLFPYAGEFEERTRAAGMHRWYLLDYDESKKMTRAAAGLAVPGVLEVEYCPKMEIVGNPQVMEICDAAPMNVVTRAGSTSFPFNDPMLDQQWHYYNNGSAMSSVSGCDINVLPVWKNYSSYVKYSGDVVVCVVDGGVDYNHEDLKDNMWHNPDKSGDNIYGYNFAQSSFAINPEDHGTHVAGTIAAVNNNGTGVCGIAGGDSKKKIRGAKIMSCQIFDGSKQGSGPEAIKWGADHGAVISQNSWGFGTATTTPSSLKAAVDYFIQNAGVDANGKQAGPMKGGIVIFAAGNENRDYSGNDYDKILNVSSVGADYKRAYYSNFGSWCDVSAPGGDAKKGNQVLSTIPGNKYGKMQGTSMACPHVSGVAALALARFGSAGYTPTALEKVLVDNLTDISSQNPSFYLGKGLINAYKTIAGSGGAAPSVPTGLQVSARSNNIDFSVRIPSDSDDGKPNSIYIYYSKTDFTSTKGAMFGMFYVEDIPVDGELSGTISGTDFNTEYYVAALACDLAGNRSSLTNRVRVTTGSNTAPLITPKSALEFSLKAHETAVADFEVSDEDGHFYYIELKPDSDATVLDTLTRDKPKIRITAAKVPEGDYTTELLVTDYYGAASSKTVKYTVEPNHKPVVASPIPDQKFTSKKAGTVELKAADYFFDEDGEELSYEFAFSDVLVANMTYSSGTFFLTPMAYGNSEITVTGTDVRGESVSQSFRVMVADGSKELTLFPNPVVDKLKIRIGSEASAVAVKIISGTGSSVFSETYSDVTPFDPIVIDMTPYPAGSYTVSVTIDGKPLKSNIVKL